MRTWPGGRAQRGEGAHGESSGSSDDSAPRPSARGAARARHRLFVRPGRRADPDRQGPRGRVEGDVRRLPAGACLFLGPGFRTLRRRRRLRGVRRREAAGRRDAILSSVAWHYAARGFARRPSRRRDGRGPGQPQEPDRPAPDPRGRRRGLRRLGRVRTRRSRCRYANRRRVVQRQHARGAGRDGDRRPVRRTRRCPGRSRAAPGRQARTGHVPGRRQGARGRRGPGRRLRGRAGRRRGRAGRRLRLRRRRRPRRARAGLANPWRRRGRQRPRRAAPRDGQSRDRSPVLRGGSVVPARDRAADRRPGADRVGLRAVQRAHRGARPTSTRASRTPCPAATSTRSTSCGRCPTPRRGSATRSRARRSST